MTEENKAIKLRMLFLGTSSFASMVLEALIRENYNLIGVFTKPDKTIHKNSEPKESPVKDLANNNHLPLFQPEKLDAKTVSEIKKLKPDIIVVVAYGKIIPREIIDIPGFGCLNIHPSLLPKFRGPSPIQNALLSGAKETGTSVILINEAMDAGDILGQKKITIADDDTYQTLSEKLANLSIELLLEILPLWVKRNLEPQPQDNSKASLSQLIEREDGKIVWEQEAEKIYNRYRALSPWPGVFSFWKNGDAIVRIKLKNISLQKINPETSHLPGEVFELGDKIGVQALLGIIILEELQLEGKNPVSVKDFLNGYPNFIGSILQ